MLNARKKIRFTVLAAALFAMAFLLAGCNPGGSDAGGLSGTRGPSQRSVGGGTSVGDASSSGTTSGGTTGGATGAAKQAR